MVTSHPWPGGWCGSWVCQGKDFSRMWSKEQDIHCFSGEVALETETDRKTETLCFSFHVFVFFLFTSLTVPLLFWCLNLFNTCVYVPTTAWPCCHLAKLHTSRSFHLSLWTSLSSVFNHFGSSFLNSTQFKNKLNCHPCGLKSRLLQSPAEREPWLGAYGGEIAPCCYTVSSRLPQQWRPVKGGGGRERARNWAGQSWRPWFCFSVFLLIDWYRWILTLVSASRRCKSTYSKQKVWLLLSPGHPTLKKQRK